jgi:tetratricopeptide (TPR) repeat protein
LCLRQNRTAEARTAFENAARSHGPEARKLRAQEYFELASISMGESAWKRAELELQQAIAADSSNGLFHVRLLDLQLGQKDAAAAESTAARFLRACGDNAGNLNILGNVYFQQEDYVRAETWARDAVARDDTLTQAHGLVAASLARQGRGAEAVDYLEPLLQKQPRNGELWVARAHVGMALGARQDVLRAAEQAVQASPNRFEAHLVYMQALGGVGRLEEAVAAAERARAFAKDPKEQQRLRTEEFKLQRALNVQRRFEVGGAAAADSAGARP